VEFVGFDLTIVLVGSLPACRGGIFWQLTMGLSVGMCARRQLGPSEGRAEGEGTALL